MNEKKSGVIDKDFESPPQKRSGKQLYTGMYAYGKWRIERCEKFSRTKIIY